MEDSQARAISDHAESPPRNMVLARNETPPQLSPEHSQSQTQRKSPSLEYNQDLPFHHGASNMASSMKAKVIIHAQNQKKVKYFTLTGEPKASKRGVFQKAFYPDLTPQRVTNRNQVESLGRVNIRHASTRNYKREYAMTVPNNSGMPSMRPRTNDNSGSERIRVKEAFAQPEDRETERNL